MLCMLANPCQLKGPKVDELSHDGLHCKSSCFSFVIVKRLRPCLAGGAVEVHVIDLTQTD